MKASSLALAVVLMLASSHGTAQNIPAKWAKSAQVLKSSNDKEELRKAAIDLIQSKEPAAIALVIQHLGDPKFLDKLDSEDDYSFRFNNLRVSCVLQALAKLPRPIGEESLLKLGQDPGFMKKYQREWAFLDASSLLEKPSDAFANFLANRAQQQNASLKRTVETLLRLNTAKAADLAAKLFFESIAHDAIRESILIMSAIYERYDPSGVRFYRHLLTADLKNPELRELAVVTLFDSRPDDWGYWRLHKEMPPHPVLKDASREVLLDLQKLAEIALKQELTPRTKQAVEKAKMEIRDLLQKK